MSLYRNIVRRAWNIAWKNKYLWFFGFFAALLGNGGEFEFFLRALLGETEVSVLPGIDAILQSPLLTADGIVNAARLFVEDPISVLISVVVLLVIIAIVGFIVWLVNVSQIALVNNAVAAISDEDKGFKAGLEAGIDKFWPVLSYNIILRLITGILFLLINWALFLSLRESGDMIGKVLYGVLFLLSIPLLMSLSFIFKYAIAFIVTRGQKFSESLRNGWNLFMKNWLISMEMAFVLFFINLLTGFALFLLLLMLAGPIYLLITLAATIKSIIAFWFVISLSLMLFMAILGVFGGILATFQITAWTTLFVELTGKGGVSKLVRVFSKE